MPGQEAQALRGTGAARGVSSVLDGRVVVCEGSAQVSVRLQELADATAMRPEAVADPESFFNQRMRLTPDQLDHLLALVRAAASS